MCHCAANQRCHGDVLVRLFDERKKKAITVVSGAPPTDLQALAAAEARKAAVVQSRVGLASLAR